MNSIFHRISVRKYEDKPVEKEKIMEILKAGMQAPSACNQQPWEFYVVTDKEKIQKLSKVTPYTGCAAGAPAVIVPVYHTEGLVAPSFAQIDMSIAQENIWLETDTLGLGGVWFGIAIAVGMAINLATVIFDSVTMGDTAHATRRIVTKSILRYVVVVILFVLFGYFQWGNLIAAFLGLLGLKIGAYLQPLWEKVKGRR